MSTLLYYIIPAGIVFFLILILVGIKIYCKLSIGYCKSKKRLDGKTVIVTGANNGIGLETAKDLAKRGARLILACRSMERGKTALDEVKRYSGNDDVILKQLDLASLESVRKFCEEIVAEESRLDILVNNAGLFVTKKEITKDGLELCMQTNHFGPFLLTNLLLDLMQKTGNARIVNTASSAHKSILKFDPENLNSEKSYSGLQVYGLSKLSNIYFTTELKRRLEEAGIKGITVNCLHPGIVHTNVLNTSNACYVKFSKLILWFYFKTPYEGAQTTIYLAVSEEVEGVSGGYYVDCKKTTPTKMARNGDNARILWEKSMVAVELKSEETIFRSEIIVETV